VVTLRLIGVSSLAKERKKILIFILKLNLIKNTTVVLFFVLLKLQNKIKCKIYFLIEANLKVKQNKTKQKSFN
jgi:hypothetical protein